MASGGCILWAALWLALPGLVSSSTLYLETLRWTHPDAVCMDGSPSGYYWKPATNRTSSGHLWVVYLQPGGWCNDQENCEERCSHSPHLCSSRDWEQELTLGGIFSDQSDDLLAAANKVYVRYCTSDAHMGDALAFGYEFRGARVVRAVLHDLVERRGLGRGDEPDTLIFGGGSAGARGAMVHLDYVPAMLGAAAAPNVQLFGFLDSPLWLDLPPLNSSFEGFANMTERVFDFANVSHLGAACEEAYPEELWKCIFGEFRLPYVTSPYMVVAAQYDSFQLNFNFGNFAPGMEWHMPSMNFEGEEAYSTEFAMRTQEAMQSLESPRRAVYAPACYAHASSLWNGGFSMNTCDGNVTMREALLQFVGLSPQMGNGPLEWVDECRGIDCGSGCHAYTHHAESSGVMPTATVSAATVALLAVAWFVG